MDESQSQQPQTVPEEPVQQEVVVQPEELRHVEEKPSRWTKFKSWLLECKRVLRATKKPSMEEFKIVVKVSGIGILIIGLIGFLLSMGKELLF